MTLTPSDTITFDRPDGLSDADWRRRQLMAQLVATGHLPWCTDHRDEGGDSWCERVEHTAAGTITMHTARTGDQPRVVVDISESVRREREIGDLNLSASDAAAIAAGLDTMISLAEITRGTPM